ncbi:MAG: glycine cleavage system protein GcvH [Pseudomonadales bacterium]|jgi:glycine cleavage system H protein|nr:glycine cleavage system protein GcvH [Pseudomonadales bacterium]MDP7145144.1 glycine cleavage system protein GcvH [Pseudomonadales bacterium]MDP7359036.1 glycine cleavage system protein GcvH [Pseudomonadales bacterium]HJN52169.1 glycine cleavage system protein GcvH [Pseudomonadales bacterium]|tara:strand:+ start:460 stop:855 length:396 start_codon:yes stop_codon:yes gene_type:complete
MADFPDSIKYTATHEWVRREDDGSVTVGISDHAQDAMGDIVYVELPEAGATVEVQDEVGVIESVKAAADIYAPIAGAITAVNEKLEDAPETVNESPYEDGWLFKIEPIESTDWDNLLDAAAYMAKCEQEEH